jgi:hypothetical protein
MPVRSHTINVLASIKIANADFAESDSSAYISLLPDRCPLFGLWECAGAANRGRL